MTERAAAPPPGPSEKRAVLFDLDGTLLDTLEDIALCMNDALRRRGFSIHTEEEYKTLVGDGIEVMIGRALAGTTVDPSEMADIVKEYRHDYNLRWREHSRPYPGIPELLAGLRERGLKLAVLSNKAHPFTVTMTQDLLPFPFDAVEGAKEGMPLKPDPAPALAIARTLGVPPEAFIYVGDTNVDMETAKASGMFAAGALWGFRTAEELLASGADVLLARPLDLLKIPGI